MRSFPVLIAAMAAVAVGIFVVSLSDAGASDSAVEVAAAVEVVIAPSISCDVDTAVYGEPVVCSALGGTSIEWPDSQVTGLEASHIPLVVGDVAVSVTDTNGVVLASTPIVITPDIAVECQSREGDPKKVFQLGSSDTRTEGWDYVFTDVSTGAQVSPGDLGHPNGGAEDGLERIVLSEEQSTGICRLISRAAEEHDGEYQLSVESEWEATQTTPMRIIGPSSKTQWAGTQPAEVEGVVVVNGLTASERVGVYQSGCS